MRRTARAFLAFTVVAAGCFGQGADPSSAPSAALGLYDTGDRLENDNPGGERTILGPIATGESSLFVFVDGNSSRSLVQIPKNGGPAVVLKAGGFTRDWSPMAGDNDTLFWIVGNGPSWEIDRRNKATGASDVLVKVPGDTGGQKSGIGLVVDVGFVYAAVGVSTSGGPDRYGPTSERPVSNFENASIVKFPKGPSSSLAATLPVGKIPNTPKTAIVQDNLSLYFVAISDAGVGTVNTVPKSLVGPTKLADLGAFDVQGFDVGLTSVVYTSSQPGKFDCTVSRVGKKGGPPVEIYKSTASRCADVAVDETHAYLPLVSWNPSHVEFQGAGVLVLTLDGSSPARIFDLGRPDFAARRIEIDATSIYLIDSFRIAKFAKDTFR